MYRRLVLVFCLMVGVIRAEDTIPLKVVEEARVAYTAGDFDSALLALSHIPGLLGVVPMLDRPEQSKRAAIFFDLGRIQIASGDTAKARLALVEAFGLDPQASKGVMSLGSDRALLTTTAYLLSMRRTHKRHALQKTTFWGAAGRSLLFPGWGQMYRGRKKRGYGFMGASAVLATVWFVADRAYSNAYNEYRNTRLDDLRLDQRGDAPASTDQFTEKFVRAKSRADRANLTLGLLAAVWLSGVFDHLIVGPAQVSISIPIR